ncbi:MAG: hypothetical protein H0W50_06305 [Parachlamydiaceae bacterium]|nr:hypothetical protein [Parachlamydiaceae bacterium]
MPISISYSNREGVEIAGLHLKNNPNQYQFQHNPSLTYLTTTGEELSYHFTLYGDKKTKRAILSEVVSPHAPHIKYSYETFNYKTKRQRICKRELPDQRVLKLRYVDEFTSKVQELISPSGKNNRMVTTHTFDRFKNGYDRSCKVKNALGEIKTYH